MPENANVRTCDALVIGSGPAGSSSAAILAEYGHKVIMLERETHPRYRIGESLLPFTYYPLKRLGLLEKMKASDFVKKYSVQFVSQSGKASQPFYFFDRYQMEVGQTWQVLRSEFDIILVNNAKEKGAELLEGMTVKEIIREDGRVVGARALDREGTLHEFRAPWTLDCTGRESLAASRNKWRIPDPQLNKVAVWTYYKGAKRDSGYDEGATTVAYVPEKGWFWYIPQHNDMVSVGVVADPKYLFREGVRDLKAVFDREVLQNKWIEEHLAAGKQVGEYRTTGEYSYRSKFCADDGLVLAGDAYGFLDPIFSSGVLFALKSGVNAADTVHEALLAHDTSAKRFTEYGKLMVQAIENMRSLVVAFYDLKFSFRALTNKYDFAAGDITDCLSGDVNKSFERLYAVVREFGNVPDPLPYGLPVGVS
jgi:flavin-dependent dehydrogenase